MKRTLPRPGSGSTTPRLYQAQRRQTLLHPRLAGLHPSRARNPSMNLIAQSIPWQPPSVVSNAFENREPSTSADTSICAYARPRTSAGAGARSAQRSTRRNADPLTARPSPRHWRGPTASPRRAVGHRFADESPSAGTADGGGSMHAFCARARNCLAARAARRGNRSAPRSDRSGFVASAR